MDLLYMNGKKRENEVTKIREKFPIGSTVELVKFEDPYTTLPIGMRGTVESIDDIGQIRVNWNEKKSGLGFMPNELKKID
jgi:hypothetical protein